jgi:hypothetical protein
MTDFLDRNSVTEAPLVGNKLAVPDILKLGIKNL